MTTEPIPLWLAGQVPGAVGEEALDTPTVTIYAPPAEINNGAAIVICPGGGYVALAPHEGEPVALWLNSLGITGVVLKYRLGPRYRHPAMLQDVSRALRMVRAHAQEFGIDRGRVGVLGFSAGGHLASTVSTHFDSGNPSASDPIERESSRPDLAVLIYPVIMLRGDYSHVWSGQTLLGENPDPALVESLSNETQVTPLTPPTFLVHSFDDEAVPVENSLYYALALKSAKVPFAMAIFEHGGHGYGMGNSDPMLATWSAQCAAWFRQRGFLGRP